MEHVIASLATTVGAFCGINICHITLAAEWQGIHNVYHRTIAMHSQQNILHPQPHALPSLVHLTLPLLPLYPTWSTLCTFPGPFLHPPGTLTLLSQSDQESNSVAAAQANVIF